MKQVIFCLLNDLFYEIIVVGFFWVVFFSVRYISQYFSNYYYIYFSVLKLPYNYRKKNKHSLDYRHFSLSFWQSWVVNKDPIWHLWNQFHDMKVSSHSYHCEYVYTYLICTLCYNICSIFFTWIHRFVCLNNIEM